MHAKLGAMTSPMAKLWTLHVDEAQIPWTPAEAGQEQRVLQARPDEGFVVTQSRYQPFYTHGLHRHTGHVFGFTTHGAWGHVEGDYPYKAGVYLYEPAGVVHRFFNGPAVSEATFVIFGAVEALDPDTGRVTGRADAAAILARYHQRCEAAGLPRPNLLS